MFGRRGSWAILTVALSIFAPLTACRSGDPAETGTGTNDCSTPSVDELGPGTVCVDTGVRPAGLFSFDNWGGHKYAADDFDYSTMAAIFGDAYVCGATDLAECVVTSDAVVASDLLNDMISGGRCEGLAVLGALYASGRGPDPATYAADSIADLSPVNDLFANVIDYWWASQFLSGTIDSSAKSRALSMDDLLDYVVDGLSKETGVTMGLYFEGRGHTVLPLAVTKTGESAYSIAVFDSNAPLESRSIDIDTATQTWTFLNGSVNSDAASETWTGGPGTIDAADIASRLGDPMIGSLGGRGGSSVVATGAAGQSLTLTVTLDDARRIVASSTGTTGAVEGVEVSAVKTGDVQQYLITLPSDIGDFAVESVATSAEVGRVDEGGAGQTSTVAVARAGGGVVSVRVPASSTSSTTIGSGQGSDADSTVITSDAAVDVQVSAKNSVISVPLSAADVVTVTPSSESGVDAIVKVASSGVESSTSIASPTAEQGVQETAILRATDGTLLSTSAAIAPVVIDQTAYSAMKAAATSAAGSGVSDDSSRIPAEVRDASLATEVGSTTQTSASITGRVSSSIAGSARIEYSTDDDRSATATTTPVDFGSGVDQRITFGLAGLRAGTTYRYRMVADIVGFTVFSTWRSFTTEVDPSSDGGAQISLVTIRDVVAQPFATSAVLSSRVSVPSGASAFVEYRRIDDTTVSTTPLQTVQPGRERLVAFAVNGLVPGAQYTARVAVRIGAAVRYSSETSFTPRDAGPIAPTNTSKIEFDISTTIGSVTSTTALIGVTVSSEAGGRLQLEFQPESESSTVSRSAVVTVAAGRSMRVWLTLSDLQSGQRYRVRPVFTLNGLAAYGTFARFSTTAVTPSNPTSGYDSTTPMSVSEISASSATVSVDVPSNFAGFVNLEYGLDRPGATVDQWPVAQSVALGETNPVRFGVTGLRSGHSYRVRAVFVSSSGVEARSGYATFATTGPADEVYYRPVVNTPIRITGGLSVSWAVPESPSSFEVQIDGTIVATTASSVTGADVTGVAVGPHSLTVVAILASGQRVASLPTSFTMGSGPVISSFAFVSATSGSLVFNYSFNPFGDAVTYGVQVTDLNEQLVRAQQGGTTSSVVNGETLQVTSLTSATQYKARLVVFVGQAMYTSDWLIVSTI